MDVRPIKTKTDHRQALRAIEGLMTARRGTPEGDLLDVLVTLVEAYEAKHFPMDLIPFIGKRNRVYEVLNRTRPLTLAMVWRLHRGLGIPAESLIRQPDKAA
jgi:HTH-type transcriptional regulator/antitoxin HigA